MAKVLPWTPISTATIDRLILALKSGEITPAQFALWVILLVNTNTCDRDLRGHLLDRDDAPLSFRSLERLFGLTRGTARTAIKRYTRSGWIEKTRSGVLRISDIESWLTSGGSRPARSGQKFSGPGNSSHPPEANYPGVAREIPGQGLDTPPPGAGATTGESAICKGQIPKPLDSDGSPNCAATAPIQRREEGEENTNGVVGVGASLPPVDVPLTEALRGAVAVPFVQAVGRPFDAKDEAALRDLVAQGHAVEEILRAVAYYGRSKNAEMRRAGLRYVAPMVKKLMFRPGATAPQLGTSPKVPSGNIRIGHTPDLIAQRRAQRLALQKDKSGDHHDSPQQ